MLSENISLAPIPYHLEVREFLKQHEAGLWKWLASAEAQAGYASELRLDLLKSTYRLAPEDHVSLYQQTEKAKAALGLQIPVTLYQAQHSIGMNAAIYYLPGEGHIVFSGNLLQTLREDELLSVLAHELAHYHLWNGYDGEFHIMDRAVTALAQNPRSSPSHQQTARHVQLYTEIYCDRASWLACGHIDPMIRALVKLQTGIQEVNPASYLRQAREVLGEKPDASKGQSHPEVYIRVHALDRWVQDGESAEEEIPALIEGIKSVDDLDLAGQIQMEMVTQRLVQHLLQPDWFQTDPVLAHARLFFENFKPVEAIDPEIPYFSQDDKTREFLDYVLLDFTVMDPALEEEPLKQAIRVAKLWGLQDSFSELARKELKIKVKEWDRLVTQSEK